MKYGFLLSDNRFDWNSSFSLISNSSRMKLRLINLLLVIALSGVFFSSCKKTTNQRLREDEKELLAKYVEKYHPNVKPTKSGLYYIETKPGIAGSDSIKSGDYVKIYYKGYLIDENDTLGVIDGYNFDSSGDFEPFSFTVGMGSVISGWDEAITYMKDGGEAKWIIPSKLGYSSSETGYIPRYSTLVFYVKIYKVYRSTDEFPVIEKQRDTGSGRLVN